MVVVVWVVFPSLSVAVIIVVVVVPATPPTPATGVSPDPPALPVASEAASLRNEFLSINAAAREIGVFLRF